MSSPILPSNRNDPVIFEAPTPQPVIWTKEDESRLDKALEEAFGPFAPPINKDAV